MLKDFKIIIKFLSKYFLPWNEKKKVFLIEINSNSYAILF